MAERDAPGLDPWMVDWRAKGLPALPTGLSRAEVPAQGWRLFDGSFMLPTLVLRESALAHNLALFADYARSLGVWLAPHGKTAMSPELMHRQLDAGAWAITAATAWQARAMVMSGVPRVLIANEVVDTASLAWLATTLDADGPEVLMYVDSLEGVAIAGAAIAGRVHRLPVLVEVGIPGGRTGARSDEVAVEVARAVARQPGLRLAGVSFFEGVVGGTERTQRDAAAAALVDRARDLAGSLGELARADGSDELIVSGGGSEFPAVVAEGLARPISGAGLPVRVVVRSGCYITHDHGGYDQSSPFGAHGRAGGPRLQPAMEVWAPVVSTPETGLAIVGMGKRDGSFDGRLPTPIAIRTADGSPREVDVTRLTTDRMNDQHLYLHIQDVEVRVGDLVGFGLAHPCTTFDKWRAIPVVDDGYAVLDVYHTLF